MAFSTYLKSAIWDFVLVCAVCVALTYTLLNGFYIAPALQYSAVPAVVAALVCAALFGIGFTKRTARLGGVVFAIAACMGLAAAYAVSGEHPLADTESSYFYFALVAVLTPVLCYLLARTRPGAGALFGVGAFASSVVQFFYGRYELAWMLVFLVASLALIVYKNYQLSARTATSVRSLSFAAGFGVAAAAVAIAVGVGSALFFGIIAPLNPPAVQVKLVTEVRALETDQVQGTSRTYLTPNMELTSNQLSDDERTTDDLKQSANGKPMPAKPKGAAQTQKESSGSMMGFDINSITQAFDFQSNADQAWRNLLLLLLIPFAAVLYFVGRRIVRSQRLKRIRRLDPSAQSVELYRFVVQRLSRVGFALPAGATVGEFARNNAVALERFDTAGKTSFVALTDLYAAAVYGDKPLSQKQADLFGDYYRGFWKAARMQLGNVKYFFRSFKL